MTQLLQNAVYGTGMILAVAVLRGALKNRLLPEARLTLWAVCLFRLFTPVAPTSALSFWGLFGRGTRELPVSVPAAPAAPSAPAAPTAPVVPTVPAVSTAPAAPTAAGIPWGAVLAAVWIAVGGVLAARYVLAYVRTRRAVNRAALLGREDARYAALPKCARLREGPMEGAPLTFGVARPTVVLSPGLEGTELACVLAHEGVHARRRDNLWHYAATAALTVFWWNPAVWLMARLLRRDVELSCDRAAVRRLGEGRRAEYANALVTLSTQAEGGTFCHGFGPKRTEERIIAIMKYKKTTIIGVALTLALVLAMTVGFASNPGTASPSPAPRMWASGFNSEGKLTDVYIELALLEASLAEHMADGSMTGEDFAFYLDKAKAASQDGVMLKWTVPEDSGLFVDKDSDGPGTVYYLDGNGNKVFVDPATMLSMFVFAPDTAVEANDSTGAEPQSNNGTDNQPEPEPEPEFVHYDSNDPDSILKEYKAMLDRRVAQGKLTQAEADELLANMDTLIEWAKNGEIKGLMFNKQANGEVTYTGKVTDFIGADDQPEPKPQSDNETNNQPDLEPQPDNGTDNQPEPEPQSDNGTDNQPEPEPQPDDVIVIYDPDDPDNPDIKVLEEYKALLERLVAQRMRTQADADKMLAGMEDLIERAKNGEIKRLAFYKQENGLVTCIVKVADFT